MSIADKLLLIAENEQKVYDKGFADGKSSVGTKIEITSTISNTQQLLDILFANIPANHSCTAYLSNCKASSHINNQIVHMYRICGLTGASRFRNNTYAGFTAVNPEYDASVTIGDVYTVIDLGVL